MGEKHQGPLPTAEKIVLESGPREWSALERGEKRYIETSGTLFLGDKKIKIQIQLTGVRSPASVAQNKGIYGMSTTFLNDDTKAACLSRAFSFFGNWVNNSMWILVGHIKGENRIPLVITHFEAVNISTYSQKLKDEPGGEFLTGLV